jgi:hypothetical protein
MVIVVERDPGARDCGEYGGCHYFILIGQRPARDNLATPHTFSAEEIANEPWNDAEMLINSLSDNTLLINK